MCTPPNRPRSGSSITVILSALGALLHSRPLALIGLLLLGGATFLVVPLAQTWLMDRVGPEAAGVIASVNISVAGVAGALGAGLGGAVLAVGLGLTWIGPIAAVPALAATVAAIGLRSGHSAPTATSGACR